MTTIIKGGEIRSIQAGIRVSRDAATLPQSDSGVLFNVTGGRVIITGIVGEVTTGIQNQANNTKLTANPDTGTSVDICAVLDIADDEVGTLYGITGTFSDAMVGENAGATVWPTAPVVVAAGSIDLDCAASNSGEVKWSLTYVPLDDGASVSAA